MSMRLVIHLDVSDYRDRVLHITLRAESDAPVPDFRFELLSSLPGVHLAGLQVRGDDGHDLEPTIHGTLIAFPARQFEMRYSVRVDYSDCVGVDHEQEFNYPFVNENEVYFGTGLFPFPVDLPARADDVHLSFDVAGLPAGWQVFSSLTTGGLSAAKLDNFFWYAAPDQQPFDIHIHGRAQNVLFRVLTQRGKNIPITPLEFEAFIQACFTWLEGHIAPYHQLEEIAFLILQAPPNFLELSAGRTFASGENVIGGIVTYGPDQPSNYQALGSTSYRDFIFEGLAHEILHFYTTTAPQGKYKSVLYPAGECSPAHANLIGESLNLYFVYHFIADYFGDQTRLLRHLQALMSRHRKSPRRMGMLDLFILDQALQARGSSLLILFGELVKWKQATRAPYASGTVIFDCARERLFLALPDEIQQHVLGTDIPDYEKFIQLP